MEAIEIQTTKKKFIISIDKNRIDNASFVRVIEILKAQILDKENVAPWVEDEKNSEKKENTPRFIAAQKFKGSASSNYSPSKYDVYEQ